MKRPALILLIGAAVLVVPFLFSRQSPEAKTAQNIREGYLRAERRVLKPGSGLEDIDQFARDLRAIDLTGAPDDVERAMNALIAAVEANAVDRRVGGDTNAANERVAAAKKDLIRALEKWRGQPF